MLASDGVFRNYCGRTADGAGVRGERRRWLCEAAFFGRKGHSHPRTDGRRGRAVCSTKGLTSSTALQETPAQPPPVAPHCSKVCPTGFRSKREHSSCTVVS